MNVSIVGLGYIGLPTAAMLASRGVQVNGVDINPTVVDTINQGRIHIEEPGLEDLVKGVVSAGKLKASQKAVPSDAFIIAVPTPFKEDHEPDLAYIRSAAETISGQLKKGDLVLLESTSPIGTTEKMSFWLSQLREDLNFPHDNETPDVNIAYCPERVLPGRALVELKENDRVVGGLTKQCALRAKELYAHFVEGNCYLTNAKTAEMVKLTENSFRDVNIAFANELSLICDTHGINVWELIDFANKHPRVSVLQPGPGVGGHCISVDPWFLVHSNPEEAQLVKKAREVNDHKPEWVVKKVMSSISDIQGEVKNIAVLGLSFKADIDDLRESPAVEITKKLATHLKTNLLVSEPHVDELPSELNDFSNVQLASTEEALRKSQLVLVLVNHKQYSELGPSWFADKVVIDTRGVVNRNR